jgi:hypothetical protein
MMRALLLLLSCLADYETVRDLARGAFTAGLVNTSVLCCIGTAFALRRSRFVRG